MNTINELLQSSTNQILQKLQEYINSEKTGRNLLLEHVLPFIQKHDFPVEIGRNNLIVTLGRNFSLREIYVSVGILYPSLHISVAIMCPDCGNHPNQRSDGTREIYTLNKLSDSGLDELLRFLNHFQNERTLSLKIDYSHLVAISA